MVAVGGPKSVTDTIKANGGLVGQRSMWAGSWMLKSGYGGLDNFYAGCKADGIQPLMLVWPIGDDDGVKFLTSGVTDMYQGVWKTRQDGLNITREVARRAKAAGVQPIVVLNNEFNKGALQASQDFASFYDDQVAIIRSECPGAKIVFAPGAWGDLAALAAFYKPQVDKSDMVGLQCGFFLPRSPNSDLATVGSKMAAAFDKLPAKPRILYDAFLSTYGGAYSPTHPFPGGDGRALEAAQAEAIRGLGAIRDLTSLVYRDLKDNPTFDVRNYGGHAERHVGLARADGSRKPGYDALLSIAKPLPVPPPPPPVTYTQAQFSAVLAERDAALVQVANLQQALEATKATLAVVEARYSNLKSAVAAALSAAL